MIILIELQVSVHQRTDARWRSVKGLEEIISLKSRFIKSEEEQIEKEKRSLDTPKQNQM